MRTAALLGLICALAGAAPAARSDVMEGNPASPVKVIIYDDLQCGDCARFRLLLDEKILPKYGAKVAFIHRDLPLGKHDWARPAALAARWVYEQNPKAGITLRRELLAQQNSITAVSLKSWLAEFAVRNGLDSKAIVDAIADPRLVALVDQDRQGAVARGVTHTPTAYVGGLAFVETIVYEDLARALDEALAK